MQKKITEATNGKATMEEKDWYHDLEMEKQRNPLLLDKAVYKAG